MLQREVTISNRLGLHARAAAKLVHLANRFDASVKLKKDHQEVNAKSILGLLILAAGTGTKLIITCSGKDEREALDSICELIDERFGEDEDKHP